MPLAIHPAEHVGVEMRHSLRRSGVPFRTTLWPRLVHRQFPASQERQATMDTRQDRPLRKGHVGLVVAGSLITGFVAALVLVIGPFGGAQEHVIMGTALLGWALGWALLAVLSMRWTDQPQRWAVVPAAVMALAGCGLLMFRPDADAFNVLGWIWPPALIALAVWMTIQSRLHLRSPTRRFMLYPLFVAAGIAGAAGSYETIQEQVDRNTTAMPGHLVDVGGRRLDFHFTGSGSPPVLLISGLAEASTYWEGWIAPAVARSTTVCVSDRAGQGWSDPPPRPQDGLAIASDLHTLLDRAHIPAPMSSSVTRQAAPTHGSSRHATWIRSPAWSCSTRSQTKPSPDYRSSLPSTP